MGYQYVFMGSRKLLDVLVPLIRQYVQKVPLEKKSRSLLDMESSLIFTGISVQRYVRLFRLCIILYFLTMPLPACLLFLLYFISNIAESFIMIKYIFSLQNLWVKAIYLQHPRSFCISGVSSSVCHVWSFHIQREQRYWNFWQ